MIRASKRYPPPRSAAQRVAVEVRDALVRFDQDRELALVYFNLYRSKAELLDASRNTWRAWTTSELLDLSSEQLQRATVFFEILDRFRLWVSATEAMPATMESRYDLALDRLRVLGAAALDALGGVPPEPPPRSVPPGWGSLDRG